MEVHFNQTLGLTPFAGQRKALGESASALEKITIGLIQPAISNALSSQRDYLSTYDPAFAQSALSAIAELQAKVTELDWQDTPIGQNVAAFDQAFAQAQRIIASMPGYQGHELQHCVEDDHQYVLLVRWATLQDHTEGFRQGPLFGKWRAIIGPFFAAPPSVEHFSLVAKSA